MIRAGLSTTRMGHETGFRWRGQEVTRLEGFTDAVLAFAVTLLVVSLEVPKTYPELIDAMRGFPAFGVCFALLAAVWYEHYHYFRRYGIENTVTVILNSALLFCVLLYVYPLKFMFSAMISETAYTEPQTRVLYTIWSCGFSAVFGVFWLLYLYAWKCRNELDLTVLEQLRTRKSMMDELFMALLGIASILIAQLGPTSSVSFAGLIYFLIPVYHTMAGWIWGRRERHLSAQLRQ
jgi:uncharacterized membrane protein